MWKTLVVALALALAVVGCKSNDTEEAAAKNKQVAQLTADLVELTGIIAPLIIEDRVPTTLECQALTEATKNLTLTITNMATDKANEIELTARVANIIAPIVNTGCMYIPVEVPEEE